MPSCLEREAAGSNASAQAGLGSATACLKKEAEVLRFVIKLSLVGTLLMAPIVPLLITHAFAHAGGGGGAGAGGAGASEAGGAGVGAGAGAGGGSGAASTSGGGHGYDVRLSYAGTHGWFYQNHFGTRVFRIQRRHQPWFSSHWFGFGDAWFGSALFGRYHARAPHRGWPVRREATHVRDSQRTHNAQRINTSVKPASLRTQIEPKSKAVADVPTTGQSTVGLSSTDKERTVHDQVAAATEVTERMTAAALTAPRDNGEPTQPLVAVVMARPEIKSVADLAGNVVAMDERYAPFSVDVWTAFVVAGTGSVEVSAGHIAAVDRLINGEVTAALLALVFPDAADAFPEIAGFKIFRVPLLPSSSKPLYN